MEKKPEGTLLFFKDLCFKLSSNLIWLHLDVENWFMAVWWKMFYFNIIACFGIKVISYYFQTILSILIQHSFECIYLYPSFCVKIRYNQVYCVKPWATRGFIVAFCYTAYRPAFGQQHKLNWIVFNAAVCIACDTDECFFKKKKKAAIWYPTFKGPRGAHLSTAVCLWLDQEDAC